MRVLGRMGAILVALWICATASAAAPIMHAYLAELWLDQHGKHYTEAERQSFLLGTLFPDIRYLRVISREETHDTGVTLQDILDAKDPFEAGKKLHGYVDEKREEFVKQWHVYRLLPEAARGERATFLKLVEDEILFNKGNWAEVRQALNHLNPAEEKTGINSLALDLWHTILKQYFTMPPSVVLNELSQFQQSGMNITAREIADWSALIAQVAKEEPLRQYVLTLITEFERLFRTANSNK